MITIILNCKISDFPEPIFNKNKDEIIGFMCPLTTKNGDKIQYMISRKLNPDLFEKLLNAAKSIIFIEEIPNIILHRIVHDKTR